MPPSIPPDYRSPARDGAARTELTDQNIGTGVKSSADASEATDAPARLPGVAVGAAVGAGAPGEAPNPAAPNLAAPNLAGAQQQEATWQEVALAKISIP